MNAPPTLVADALFKDPRAAKGKQLMLEALQEHCKKLTGIKPPDPTLKLSYDEVIASFNESRGGKLWFPYIGSGIGNGPLVELMDGSVKYDCICGIGPHYWGHSHPALVEAALDAALSDTIMQGNLQQNFDAVQMSRLLIEASGMDHCFLTTSGAMANENALKLALHKKSSAYRILAFEKCFVGRSLAESQITDKPAFREGLPVVYHVDYVPFYDPQRPEESTEAAVVALKKHLSRYPKQHALMVFELVQGEGGFYAGTTEFFTALMQILKEREIAIFVDEVQTFGRTPALFAFQHFALHEWVDIVSIGKLSQVCATLFRNSFKPQAGLLSQTFTGSTSSIRAGIVLVKGLLEGNYFGTKGCIQKVHSHFTQKLLAIAGKHPDLIQGPFGIGSMVAFTPYDGDIHKATKLSHSLFEEGIITFIAGTHPTRIRFLLPAGVLSTKDIDIIAKIVESVLLKGP